jgi:hypothetical protein
MIAGEKGSLTLESAVELRAAQAGSNLILQRELDNLPIAEAVGLTVISHILGSMAGVVEKGIEFTSTDIGLGAGNTLTFVMAPMVLRVERSVESAMEHPDPMVSASAAGMWQSYSGQVIADPDLAVY